MPERTLSIIKPDGVSQNIIGKLLERIEGAGLRILALRMVRLSQVQAKAFYHVHRERPFYDSLTRFMSEGPVVVMILEGERAIATLRQIMGATDPSKADPGTIRRDFAASVERNVIHGSDSPESAAFEIGFFFGGIDMV